MALPTAWVMDGAVFAKVLVISLGVGDEMAELGTAHIPLT
jgi:hypothetical protein